MILRYSPCLHYKRTSTTTEDGLHIRHNQELWVLNKGCRPKSLCWPYKKRLSEWHEWTFNKRQKPSLSALSLPNAHAIAYFGVRRRMIIATVLGTWFHTPWRVTWLCNIIQVIMRHIHLTPVIIELMSERPPILIPVNASSGVVRQITLTWQMLE